MPVRGYILGVAVLSALIFVLTLVFVIWRPKHVSIGWSACGGAVLALIAGAVSLHDIAEVTESSGMRHLPLSPLLSFH